MIWPRRRRRSSPDHSFHVHISVDRLIRAGRRRRLFRAIGIFLLVPLCVTLGVLFLFGPMWILGPSSDGEPSTWALVWLVGWTFGTLIVGTVRSIYKDLESDNDGDS